MTIRRRLDSGFLSVLFPILGLWAAGTVAAAPPNDTCATAMHLALDMPSAGLIDGLTADDYQLSGPDCFTGVEHVESTAAGGEVVYSFTAPDSDRYSFRVTDYDGPGNLVLYVASSCPADPAPAVVADCVGAANRTSTSAEEVMCLTLAQGQSLFVFIDEDTPSAGGNFTLEVNRCAREEETNNTPVTANTLTCPVEGSIFPSGEADFFTLGLPADGSRAFAIADGIAANDGGDFDLRVTSNVDTLEYDDQDNDAPFSGLAPTVSGTPLPAGHPTFLRMSYRSALIRSEPYRLYFYTQPPIESATAETEPNDTPAQAGNAPNRYYSGTLGSGTDADLFSFAATAGQLLHLGLDLDPLRDETPIDGALALLDSNGAVLLAVDDPASTSHADPGTGVLDASTPSSPGESLLYRITADGTYYARVTLSGPTGGDYLLSMATDCKTFPPTDLSVAMLDAPDPVFRSSVLTYDITVTNLTAETARNVVGFDPLAPGLEFLSAMASQGHCSTTTVTGIIVSCLLGDLPSFSSATVTINVGPTVSTGCDVPVINAFRVTSDTLDTESDNDRAVVQSVVLDPVGDSDADGALDGDDNCLCLANPDQADNDFDNLGDPCDSNDDGDSVLDTEDNCPLVYNPGQEDLDDDELGNACDPDDDGDSVLDTEDNCPLLSNPGQENTDGDALGDACDPDDDNDGVLDASDNCPHIANSAQQDLDGDALGNPCDPDDDGDGVDDGPDNCNFEINPGQENHDGDGQGDVCDPDDDNDGIFDQVDNCPLAANPGQTDYDADTLGDACDPDDDMDDDGVLDGADNCPLLANPDQFDADLDEQGDACDPDDDNDGLADGADCQPFSTNNCADVNPCTDDSCDIPSLTCLHPIVPYPCEAPDLALTKISLPDLLFLGSPLTYILTATNQTSLPMLNVVVTDPLPAGLSADFVEPTQGSCSGTDTVVCNLGDLGGFDTASVVITVTPLLTTGCTAPLTNTGSLTTASLDTEPGNDQASASTVVLDPAVDHDGDGEPEGTDNCRCLSNPGQSDVDGDGLGDPCDWDADDDGLFNAHDNCPLAFNPGQENNDDDGTGNACDPDADNDGVDNGADNCPTAPNPGQEDSDLDSTGDECDPDDDNDGVTDGLDNCRFVANPDQQNHDPDSLGDACDADDDNDGVLDGVDCEPFSAANCNDGNPCTADACNLPGLNCTHTPNSSTCSDGNACTSGDVCSGGVCIGGPPPDCNDNNLCTNDSCNPATGCTHINNTVPCTDGSACTIGDVCSGGVCLGSVVNCDDGNSCTADGCNAGTGCTHQPLSGQVCNDGNACTSGDTCSNGSCVGGPPPNCNDGNPCTDDSCIAPGGCSHAPNVLPCNDGSLCTTGDTCSGGSCSGGPPLNCDDGDPCSTDTCNPATGCVSVFACDDGNTCTLDVCGPAGCEHSSNGTCGDNPATAGFWKRVCLNGSMAGEKVSAVDVDCVNDSCTFAGVTTIAGLCDRLKPNPLTERCELAEAQFMSLLLNVCRGRIGDADAINSECGSNQTVGQSVAQADGLLCTPAPGQDCILADCVSKEINTGQAMRLNTLLLRRISPTQIGLTWQKPLDAGAVGITGYRVWRRTPADWWVIVGEVSGLKWDGPLGDPNVSYEYEVRPILP